MTERLLAHREPLYPGRLLGHLIAGRWFQEQIAPCDPTDARALRDPPSTGWLAPPPPDLGRLRRPSLPVRHMGPAARQRGLQQSHKAQRRITGVVALDLELGQFLER